MSIYLKILFALTLFAGVIGLKAHFYKECRTVHDSVIYCLAR